MTDNKNVVSPINYVAVFSILLMLFITACTDKVAKDSDADGISEELDNCPDIANPEQMDSDADNLGDSCDVVVTSLGRASELSDSKVHLTYFAKIPPPPPGLFSIYNGTSTSQTWTSKVEPAVEWFSLSKQGLVEAGSVETISATLNAEQLLGSEVADTRVTISLDNGQHYATNFGITIAPVLQPGDCAYTVTLTKFTVINRQAILLDGLALEPFADINAVGVGRLRSPVAGTHVLGAGQSVAPNAQIGVGFAEKNSQVNLQVIADVDEIDFPPVNPDDLRAQGQSGTVNFAFVCDFGRRKQVIQVPVIGNVPGEGNGSVEIEVEVSWDP